MSSQTHQTLTSKRFCIVNSGDSEQTPPGTGTVELRPLVISRPTPPSHLQLAPVSRDTSGRRQQQLMLTWRSKEHVAERVNCDRQYVPARNDECRRPGLVVCVCAQPVSGDETPQCGDEDRDNSCGRGDKRARQSLITQHDSDDWLYHQPHHSWSASRYRPSHDTSRHRFIATAAVDDDDDDGGERGSSARRVDDDELKSQLMVDYDVDCQQSSTRTCTEDTSLDSAGSSLVRCTCSSQQWSAERHQHSPRRRRSQQHDAESGSPSKKRLTLSCMLADFSALLRRVRRLRVSRTVGDHETRV